MGTVVHGNPATWHHHFCPACRRDEPPLVAIRK
jgi:hypothetical protein